jgi:OB-fold nucleic acid binding domain
MYACLFQPAPDHSPDLLLALAGDFSPRYERHGDGLVSIDIGGLGRLFGSARDIGEELRRDAAARGLRVHVAIASTRTAALVLAIARPGLTVVDAGDEGRALALIPIGILEKISACGLASEASGPARDRREPLRSANAARELTDLTIFRTWGLKTLGDLAALPSADLAARLGSQGLIWQAIARGEDQRPLVPTLADERFEASLDLEWPIDGLEPLSFVLTRLLEPLSIRLERRDRGAAVLHVELRLVATGRLETGLGSSSGRDLSPTIYARSLQLPSPMRDVRTLRTLALLDLESHPPPGAIERVTILIEPTPGRVLQHRLFTRAQPTPEQLSTLLARLGALMGQDRIGAPAAVDSYRPGAFEMRTFASAGGLASAASGPAGDSREPLRSAKALSDAAGVGPRRTEECGAPRGLDDASACGLASAASGPARGGGAPRGLENASACGLASEASGPASPLKPMTEAERLVADYAGMGLTAGRHPMALRREELAMRGVLRACDLPRARQGRRVRVAGMVITRQRPGTAKGFVFLTLEDETGIANIIVRPDLFARDRLVIVEEPFLLVDGVLQSQDGVTSIRAEQVSGLRGVDIDFDAHDFY